MQRKINYPHPLDYERLAHIILIVRCNIIAP